MEETTSEDEEADTEKDSQEWTGRTTLEVGLKSLEFEAAEAVEEKSRELLEENVSKWEPAR